MWKLWVHFVSMHQPVDSSAAGLFVDSRFAMRGQSPLHHSEVNSSDNR